jgi:small subunit ribosomal protein S6
MVLVFNGMLDDKTLEKEVLTIEDQLKKNSPSDQPPKVERWGKRRLAYPIKKKNQGDYTLFGFSVPTGFIKELETGFHLNPNLLRFLIAKKSG